MLTVTLALRLPAEAAARLTDTNAAPYRRLTELADAIRVGEVELVDKPDSSSPATALQSLLSPQEYRLVMALQARRGLLVPYDVLRRAMWGEAALDTGDTRIIRAHVKGIRTKLRLLGLDPWCIRAAKERGYLLVGDTDLLPPDAPRLAPMRATVTRLP